MTRASLARATEPLAADGVRAVVPIRDDASWPISREVRTWIRPHDRRVEAAGGCRPPVCRLPSKSPRLNLLGRDPRIEPKWVHGRRADVGPERKRPAAELKQRLCHHHRSPLLPPLAQRAS